MRVVKASKGVGKSASPRMLTQVQVTELFEAKAQKRLGMSGAEFLRRMERGQLPDHPAVDEVAILVGGSEA